MCVAMPGKVIAINGIKAIVDFYGNTVEANAGLVSAKTGDYVLVHAGCILQVLSKEEGDTLTDLFCEIGVYDAKTAIDGGNAVNATKSANETKRAEEAENEEKIK